jgi:PhnB protein
MIEVTPFLAVRDAERAVEFYAAAFGAEELERLTAPSGAIVAELASGEARFSLATEAPELGTPSPETAGVTTVRLSLHVDDPDAVQRRAVEAGAVETFPVADQPYGWRQGRVVDPFGHHWLVGRRL